MSPAQIDERVQLLDEQIAVMRTEMRQVRYNIEKLEALTKKNNKQIAKVGKQQNNSNNGSFFAGKTTPAAGGPCRRTALDLADDGQMDEEGASNDVDMQRKRCAIIKTSLGRVVFLPRIGLADPDTLKPGDLVAVNEDTYHIVEQLPRHYDERVSAMEVDERPLEKFDSIGGYEEQLKELKAAVVRFSMMWFFSKIRISPFFSRWWRFGRRSVSRALAFVHQRVCSCTGHQVFFFLS